MKLRPFLAALSLIGITEICPSTLRGDGGAQSATNEVGVILMLNGGKSTVESNAPVELVVIYTNRSSNESYWIRTTTPFEADPKVAFAITTPSGEHIVSHGSPGFSSFASDSLLPPQKSVRFFAAMSDLNGFGSDTGICRFNELGTYHITLTARGICRQGDPKAALTITSNPLDLEIVPALYTGNRDDGKFVVRGKTLDEWAKYGYSNRDLNIRPEQTAANEAMKLAGTNAVPTLLEWLAAADLSTGRTNADFWNFAAVRGFSALAGWQTKDRAPYLDLRSAATGVVKTYKQNISVSSRTAACAILDCLGTTIDPAAIEVIPQLCSDATNDATTLIGYHAELALSNIRSKAPVIVPFLAKVLHDSKETDHFINTGAIKALGYFGTNARPAIRALLEFQNRPGATPGLAVPLALRKIDPDGSGTAEAVANPSHN